jgi:hypothetical protein
LLLLLLQVLRLMQLVRQQVLLEVRLLVAQAAEEVLEAAVLLENQKDIGDVNLENYQRHD